MSVIKVYAVTSGVSLRDERVHMVYLDFDKAQEFVLCCPNSPCITAKNAWYDEHTGHVYLLADPEPWSPGMDREKEREKIRAAALAKLSPTERRVLGLDAP